MKTCPDCKGFVRTQEDLNHHKAVKHSSRQIISYFEREALLEDVKSLYGDFYRYQMENKHSISLEEYMDKFFSRLEEVWFVAQQIKGKGILREEVF